MALLRLLHRRAYAGFLMVVRQAEADKPARPLKRRHRSRQRLASGGSDAGSGGSDGAAAAGGAAGSKPTSIGNGVVRRTRLSPTDPLRQKFVIVAPEKRDIVGTFEGVQPSTVIPFLDELLATYCVDKKNLVAAGQGSGGRFLGTVLCNGRAIATSPDIHFSAAAILGAYSGCATWPPIPLLFVHGYSASESRALNDDADGAKALAKFTANSGCGTTSVAFPLRSCRTASPITPGCVEYESCAAPLRFCVHDDPIQANSGWACIANDELLSFFDAHRVE